MGPWAQALGPGSSLRGLRVRGPGPGDPRWVDLVKTKEPRRSSVPNGGGMAFSASHMCEVMANQVLTSMVQILGTRGPGLRAPSPADCRPASFSTGNPPGKWDLEKLTCVVNFFWSLA